MSRRAASLCAALALWPLGAWAEITGAPAEFDACVLEMLADNADNFTAPMVAPVICGEAYYPIRQSCTVVEYMLFDKRSACAAQDLAFWQAEVAARTAAALADGREGTGSMHDSGLARCADEIEAGPERVTCETEVYWRTTMYFLSADAQIEAAQ